MYSLFKEQTREGQEISTSPGLTTSCMSPTIRNRNNFPCSYKAFSSSRKKRSSFIIQSVPSISVRSLASSIARDSNRGMQRRQHGGPDGLSQRGTPLKREKAHGRERGSMRPFSLTRERKENPTALPLPREKANSPSSSCSLHGSKRFRTHARTHAREGR